MWSQRPAGSLCFPWGAPNPYSLGYCHSHRIARGYHTQWGWPEFATVRQGAIHSFPYLPIHLGTVLYIMPLGFDLHCCPQKPLKIWGWVGSESLGNRDWGPPEEGSLPLLGSNFGNISRLSSFVPKQNVYHLQVQREGKSRWGLANPSSSSGGGGIFLMSSGHRRGLLFTFPCFLGIEL